MTTSYLTGSIEARRKLRLETIARAAALGHNLGQFDHMGPTGAAACTDPRCGMGVTFTLDPDPGAPAIIGAAITWRCPGKPNRRTIRYATRS